MNNNKNTTKKPNNLPIIIIIIVLAVIAIGLVVYAFVAGSNGDNDIIIIPDPDNNQDRVISNDDDSNDENVSGVRKTDASEKLVNVYIRNGMLDINNCMKLDQLPPQNAPYIVNLDGKFYVPIRNYLTTEEKFTNWAEDKDTGKWTANRRNRYDIGYIYVTVQPELNLITMSEITENNGEIISHTYSEEALYVGAKDLNEVFAPIDALAPLLGYISIEFDNIQNILMLHERKEEAPTEAEPELTPEQEAALRAEEERIRAEEEARRQSQVDPTIGTPEHEHVYEENWFVAKEATCTEDGYYIRECVELCEGGRQTQIIPAYGHRYGSDGVCYICGHHR